MNSLLVGLEAEKACLEKLISLLAQEQHAIGESRFDDLQAITQEKAGLLDRVAELDRQRETLLLAAGFSTDVAGANAAAAAAGPATCQAWADLLVLAERARTDNLRNGAIVWTHLDFTQRALNFLQSSVQHFYGPDGIRTTAAGGGTRLALG